MTYIDKIILNLGTKIIIEHLFPQFLKWVLDFMYACIGITRSGLLLQRAAATVVILITFYNYLDYKRFKYLRRLRVVVTTVVVVVVI